MGCIHNINMGCCEPVLAPVENFYTKGQVDELIEEAVISGCCITPEEVDEKIEEAISGITVSGVTEERLEEAIAEVESEIPSIDGLASEEFVMDYTYDKQTIDDKVAEVESEIPSIDGLASEEFVTSYTYDKQTIDEKVASGGTFDPTQYYNKTQTNSLLDLKADTADTYTKTEVNSLVDSKADITALTQVNNALTAHTANTTVHVTEADKNTWNNKQDTLVSGTNIKTINNQSLLGSGNIDIQSGSDINVVQTTGASTTDVMSQNAVTTQLNNKANKTAAVGGYRFGSSSDGDYIQYKNVNNSDIDNSIYYPKINGKSILTSNNIYAQNNYNFQLVETSAITTSVTSSSTDAQVPSAKAVYDAIQEGGGSTYTAGDGIDITNNVISTVTKFWCGDEAAYNQIAIKDINTIYLIHS